jgi:hypothetical protein
MSLPILESDIFQMVDFVRFFHADLADMFGELSFFLG